MIGFTRKRAKAKCCTRPISAFGVMSPRNCIRPTQPPGGIHILIVRTPRSRHGPLWRGAQRWKSCRNGTWLRGRQWMTYWASAWFITCSFTKVLIDQVIIGWWSCQLMRTSPYSVLNWKGCAFVKWSTNDVVN
jgi:hypothetical protein